MERLSLVCRVVHFASSGLLLGTITLNYLFKTNEFLDDDPNFFPLVLPLAGLLSLASGVAAYVLLKPQHNNANANADAVQKGNLTGT